MNVTVKVSVGSLNSTTYLVLFSFKNKFSLMLLFCDTTGGGLTTRSGNGCERGVRWAKIPIFDRISNINKFEIFETILFLSKD